MEVYLQLAEKYSNRLSQLKRQYNILSIFRLVIVVIFCLIFYSFVRTADPVKFGYLFLAVISFLVIIKIHLRMGENIKMNEALLNINTDEITFLKHEGIPFADGEEFKDAAHFYSYDLDFFGNRSLFHHLNRTAVYIGKMKLARALLSLLPEREIVLNQQAIKELSVKIDWRQQLAATGKINNDSKVVFEKLMQWSGAKSNLLPKAVLIIGYVSPIILCASLLWYALFKETLFLSIGNALILLNLIVLSTQYKKIRKELISAEKVAKIIHQYSMIIDKIEKEEFKSEKMLLLK
ncbi:MAG: DNA mismatch repair protein, partial [Bacteroidia bacterium]